MPNEFRDRLHEVIGIAPSLTHDPNAAVALAMTPGVNETGIQAVAATADGVRWRNWLEGLSPERRAQEWGRLSPQMRALTEGAGYNPVAPGVTLPAPAPALAPERGGIAGFIDDIGDAAGAVKDAVFSGGGAVLHAAGAPLRAVQRFQRTNMIAGSRARPDDPMFISALGGWGVGLRNPSDYARAWREAEIGEKIYNPDQLRSVRATYDRETFELAKRIAEGESPDSIMNSANGNPELQQMYVNMIHNPILQEAVDALNGSKLSMGRAIAQDLGIDKNSKWFTTVSGSVDAANSLLLDPLLVGGKAVKVANIARYGVRGASMQRVDELFENVGVGERALGAVGMGRGNNVTRYWEGALPNINTILAREAGTIEGTDVAKVGQAFDQLQTNYKQALPMLNDLRDYAKAEGTSTLDMADIKMFLRSQAGASHLLTGQAAYRAPLMPSKGIIQQRLGDKIRDQVRARGIGWFERPSKDAASILVGAVDELESGYKYTPVLADDLVEGLSTMKPKERTRAIRERALAMRDDGRTYERMNKDGSWAPVRPDQIAPSSFLAGRVRIREDKLPVLQEQGRTLRQLREHSRMYRAGMLASRLVEQVPHARNGRLQLDHQDAAKVIYNLARAYLPRWHANQVAGTFAAADIGGRMNIYKGLLHTMGEAAGITRKLDGTVDEVGQEWLQKYVDSVDELGLGSNRAYSAVRGNDEFADGTKHALFESQFSTEVALPSFRELHDLAARKGMASAMGHAVTHRHLDTFMEKFWRPSVLIRPALSLRNALEENVRHISAHGVWDWSKGQYARHLMDKQAKELAKTGFVADITGKLPEIGRTLDIDEMRYLDDVDEDGLTDYLEGIRDTNARALSNREAGMDVEQWRGERRGVKQADIKFRQAGNYKPQDTTGGTGVMRWTQELQRKLASSELGRAALFDIEDRATAITKMQDLILSDKWQRNREYSRAFRQLVGDAADDPAARREAARIWAERSYNDIAHLLSDPAGRLNTDLISELRIIGPDGRAILNRQAINTKRLGKVPEESRPTHVVAPDVMILDATPTDMWTRVVEKGYEWTGQLTGVLGKNAIYWANYLDARKAMSEWQSVLVDDHFQTLVKRRGLKLSDKEMAEQVAQARKEAEASAAKIVARQALRAAENRTLAYVDNPDVRSQASVILRNVVPFGRAQEEFFRRWARNVRHHPETIRKMQLVYEGGEHSGAIEQDEQGNAVFVYPGTRHMQELMYNVGQKFGWNWAMSPVPHRMTSQIRFLNQGMDPKNVLPSFGPIAAMPMKAVEAMFPESVALKQANRAVLGDMAANSGTFGTLVPTFARRVYQSGIFGNESEQLASSMKQAVVYLEAAGRTPPDGADPQVLEDYQEDVRTWSRVHLFMRAIFGTTAPAAPSEMGAPAEAPIGDRLENDPGVWLAEHRVIETFRKKYYPTIESEFRAEVQRLNGNYSEALANWVRDRPHELPFTVGKSESEFGGYVPATEQAGLFFEQNRGLFKDFPAAAVLFMPQGKGEFDMDVYRSQLGSGMRNRKDFATFARDLKLVGNLQTYYNLKEKSDAIISEAKARNDQDAVRAEREQWAARSKLFKANYPSVKSYLEDYTKRKQDRDRVMLELQRMVETNNMPNIPGAPVIRDMVQMYNWRQSMLERYPGRTDAELAAKRAIKDRFTTEAKAMAAKDLNADMLYQRLFRGLEDD